MLLFAHQRAAGLERQASGELTIDVTDVQRNRRARTPTARRSTEPRAVRWTLIAVALAFLALFLVLPLVAVFVAGARKGVGAYLGRRSPSPTPLRRSS